MLFMVDARDTRRLVEKFLETDPVIKKGLQRGIINSRALARFIQEADGVDASPDAIVGIIRRYPVAEREPIANRDGFRELELVVRSGVGDLILENGAGTMKRIAEFSGSIKSNRGESLRVVVGVRAIRVVADQRALSQFRETFLDKDVLRFSTNLAEISILIPPTRSELKGYFAIIMSELALNDVDVHGIMCSALETILLVNEKDAAKGLEALQRMIANEPIPGTPARSMREIARPYQ
jgi:hypothetical protein